MQKLDGKLVADKIIADIKKDIPYRRGCSHSLVIITIGEDEASKIYVGRKKKKAEECGLIPIHLQLGEDTNIFMLESLIKSFNELDYVRGIIVQKPLTKKLKPHEKDIDLLIDPSKDVDGFHPMSKYKACTPKGVITLLDAYEVPYHGKNVVIAGRSEIVSKPLAKMFMDRDCTVTMIHSKTDRLTVRRLIDDCDIFVSAIGKPKYWTNEDLSHGKDKLVLIDIGINRDENGKVCGDVDPLAYKNFEYYTPVPGGVGVMTVATLMDNTSKLAF